MTTITDNSTVAELMNALDNAVILECTSRMKKERILAGWNRAQSVYTDPVSKLADFVVNPQGAHDRTESQMREQEARYLSTGRITNFNLEGEKAVPSRKLENLGQIDLRTPTEVEQDRNIMLLDMLKIEHNLSNDELTNKAVDSLVKDWLQSYKDRTKELKTLQAERLEENKLLVEKLNKQKAVLDNLKVVFKLPDEAITEYKPDELGDTVNITVPIAKRDRLLIALSGKIDLDLLEKLENKTKVKTSFNLTVSLLESVGV